MSKAPHYLYLRQPNAYGHAKALDAIAHDGLTDVYNAILMGSCVEKTVGEMGISREAQDEFAIMSYNRAREAQERGYFADEIQHLSFQERNGKEHTID